MRESVAACRLSIRGVRFCEEGRGRAVVRVRRVRRARARARARGWCMVGWMDLNGEGREVDGGDSSAVLVL